MVTGILIVMFAFLGIVGAALAFAWIASLCEDHQDHREARP